MSLGRAQRSDDLTLVCALPRERRTGPPSAICRQQTCDRRFGVPTHSRPARPGADPGQRMRTRGPSVKIISDIDQRAMTWLAMYDLIANEPERLAGQTDHSVDRSDVLDLCHHRERVPCAESPTIRSGRGHRRCASLAAPGKPFHPLRVKLGLIQRVYNLQQLGPEPLRSVPTMLATGPRRESPKCSISVQIAYCNCEFCTPSIWCPIRSTGNLA